MVAATRAPPGNYAFAVVSRSHESEFNLVNPYLIVPASPQLMFDRDGKRVPHKDTTKSS